MTRPLFLLQKLDFVLVLLCTFFGDCTFRISSNVLLLYLFLKDLQKADTNQMFRVASVSSRTAAGAIQLPRRWHGDSLPESAKTIPIVFVRRSGEEKHVKAAPGQNLLRL